MWKDPIVEEVRKGREEHAAKFNYDIKAIIRSLKEQEQKSGRNIVSFIEKNEGIKTPSLNVAGS